MHDGLKLILSVGGANGSGNFAAVASDPQKTTTFIQSAKALVAEHNLDGFDSMLHLLISLFFRLEANIYFF